MNVILEDDDDEAIMAAVLDIMNEREEGGVPDRIDVDIEGWRLLSNASFKANFRMDRIVFQRLIVAVGVQATRSGLLQRIREPVDLKLMMGLWPIFNPDTYRSSAHHFGKDKKSIYRHYLFVIEVLRQLADKYIKWPNDIQRDTIKVAFEQRYGYPGVVGAIDGVHIQITAPLDQPRRYINRHDNYSMIVQAVCDHELLYHDVFVGGPGALGDVRNFDNSPLSNNLLLRDDMLSPGEHLVGDGAYVLTDKIMIPYVDVHLEEDQRFHNYLLSKCRSGIERSFSQLRGRHRRLKMLPMRHAERVAVHISASFVLHNFIKLEGFEMEGLAPAPMAVAPIDVLNERDVAARNAGAIRRENICEMLN